MCPAISYKKKNIKGRDIIYSDLEISEYLSPMNNLSMSDKRRMFQIRNMMVDIPSIFSKLNEKMKCVCNEL